MKKIYFIYPMIFSLFIYSCGIDTNCNRPGEFGAYKFEYQVQMNPIADTFHVGDTIHFFSDFSNDIYETGENRTFGFIDTDLRYSSSIFKIDTANYRTNAILDFSIGSNHDVSYQNFSSGKVRMNLDIDYIQDNYSFSYYIIPNHVGLYYSLSTISPVQEPDFIERCSNFAIDGYTIMNTSTDNNIDYLLDSPDPFINSLWDSPNNDFVEGGGYCFYVVE